MSDLLLSRNADVGVGGNVPLFTLWDKTTGAQKVRGIMSFSRANMFLLTVDPRIKSIRDFKDTDRIAMTDVRSTTYSMVIQMAAAKEYGWDQRNRYDRMTVAMGNNEALAAMLSGRMEVKSHMTILPHSTMELKSGKVRILLNSKDLLGRALHDGGLLHHRTASSRKIRRPTRRSSRASRRRSTSSTRIPARRRRSS